MGDESVFSQPLSHAPSGPVPRTRGVPALKGHLGPWDNRGFVSTSPAAPSSHQAPSPSRSCCCSCSPATVTQVGAARRAHPTLPSSLSAPHPAPGLSGHPGSPLLPLCSVCSARPLPAPLRWHQEQLSRGASREMVQFYCTGATGWSTGQSGLLRLPPAPAREPRVGLVGFIFVGLFSFFVLCFFPARAGVTPSPRAPGRQPPLPGPGSASGKPRGCFCLWVCILVALSDFCFIISSNRLWCQKH